MTPFGFLAFNGMEELDYVGPWEMVGVWHEYFGGPEPLAIAEHAGPVTCHKGLKILVEQSWSDAPALDYLLVPGGDGRKCESDNPALIDYLKQAARNGTTILSVCTGSFLLQKAGLLEGQEACTHWTALDELRGVHPQVSTKRYQKGEKIWTSAGVSAGMDMMLAFIAQEAGEHLAAGVQLAAEYFPDATIYGELGKSGPPLPAYVDRTD